MRTTKRAVLQHTIPDLPGCITCGETLERTLENAEDAKRVWLMATLEDGMEIKEPAVA
ncbi:MAG: type II toxin-antitoxin system HicB family antitoxin [Synergistaceae bacterium]|nr:type II toxin-antitoxin system HicB family antitoxin [Synergistaceae bacterium]